MTNMGENTKQAREAKLRSPLVSTIALNPAALAQYASFPSLQLIKEMIRLRNMIRSSFLYRDLSD